jgi:signal transduction histidine kinase
LAASELAVQPTEARRLSMRTWWWIAFWSAGAAAGAGVLAIALSDEGLDTLSFLFVVVGWSFIASGLIAWGRRPENRLGRLMVGLGFAWLAGPLLGEVPWSVTFTAGIIVGDAWVVLFALFLVSFPYGRLTSQLDSLVVASFFVSVVVLELVWLLFLDLGDDPGNALLVSPNEGVADAIDLIQRVIIVAASIVLTATLARRWLVATRPLRRALTPTLAGATVILYAAGLVILDEFRERPRALQIVLFLTLAAVPFAVLADILRARLARSMLGDLFLELQASPAPADLPGALARALRDPSLTLAYWLPEFRTYADLDGRRVELPDGAAGRATTVIDRDGEHVAALVHDASLREDPALLDAVGAAAGMALEHARLQSELRARLEELRGSRARIVEATQEERKRLERNLHDGAQQRLVSLSLELGMLERQLGDDSEARRRLDQARREVADSLQELRELARGLHPAVVTGHGLEVALESLVARSPVPVELSVELAERVPEPVEVAAYYLVAESLTNVAKYAHASTARVGVTHAGGDLVVEVVDDGVGGATTETGTGLRGLADRVEALDGRLRVWSPEGGGTRVRAEIPCA